MHLPLPRHRGRWVYALCDPAGEVRYVGKCEGYLNSRWRGHLAEATSGRGHNHRLAWIRGLLARGEAPFCAVLEEVGQEGDLAARERHWIAKLRAMDARLVNGTDGGEGMPNPSEATRARLRARPLSGWAADPAIRERGHEASRRLKAERDASGETERNLRAALERKRTRRGLPAEPMCGERLAEFKVENAIRMGQANKGKAKSAEHRQKLAEATRRQIAEHGHPRAGRPASDETRAKLRAAWARRKARTEGGGAQ